MGEYYLNPLATNPAADYSNINTDHNWAFNNLISGWVECVNPADGSLDTLAYASANSITITGADRTSVYTPGTKLKLTQTTDKFFIVIASVYSGGNTAIYVDGRGIYTIANAAISSPCFSRVYHPAGFPDWMIKPDGWQMAFETWTYASALSITVQGDVTTHYQAFDCFKLTDVTVKYFEVHNLSYNAGTGYTTINLSGFGLYTLSGGAITDTYYAKTVPQGFANYNHTPPGMISYFAKPTAPDGWLKCNGASVSRATYAALYAAIKTMHNLTFSVNISTNIITAIGHGFSTGDAVDVYTEAAIGVIPAGLVVGTTYYVRNISTNTLTLHPTAADAAANTNVIDITDTGTGLFTIAPIATFKVPERRGEFQRAWDDGRGIDSGRLFGSSQLDAMQGHWHNVNQYYIDTGGSTTTHSLVISTTGLVQTYYSTLRVGDPLSDGTHGTPRIASETRSRNYADLCCIKY